MHGCMCVCRSDAQWTELIPYIVSTLSNPNPSIRCTSLTLVRHVVDYVGSVGCCMPLFAQSPVCCSFRCTKRRTTFRTSRRVSLGAAMAAMAAMARRLLMFAAAVGAAAEPCVCHCAGSCGGAWSFAVPSPAGPAAGPLHRGSLPGATGAAVVTWRHSGDLGVRVCL